MLRRSGGVKFEQVVGLIDQVPEQNRRNILLSLGHLPDAGEHIDVNDSCMVHRLNYLKLCLLHAAVFSIGGFVTAQELCVPVEAAIQYIWNCGLIL